jgi:hypothetical protein
MTQKGEDHRLVAIFTTASQQEINKREEEAKRPTVQKIQDLVAANFFGRDPSFKFSELGKCNATLNRAGFIIQSTETDDFIQVLDNENGTFNITAYPAMSKPRETSLEETLKALGQFHGRYKNTVSPPQPRQQPPIFGNGGLH